MDRFEAVLLSVGVALYQEHLLGEPVWSVGLLRVPVPEVLLPERHRREFGIRAHRPDGHELANSEAPRLLHELGTHHQVLVEEAAGILPVRADPTDDGGQMKNNVRM